MPQKPIPILKDKFADGKTPTGSDFGDILDSYFHKSTKIEQSQVLGLNDDFATKDELNNATTKFKGYHTNLAKLQAEYPQAQNKKDYYAFVGSPYPGTVWKVYTDGGVWTDTGEVPTQEEIDLTEYAKKDDLTPIKDAQSDLENAIYISSDWAVIGGVTWQNGYYIDLSGTVTGGGTNTLYKMSSFIAVTPGETYKATLQAGNISVIQGYINGVVSSALRVVGLDTNSPLEYEFTIPDNINEIRLSCRKELTNPILKIGNGKENRVDLLEGEINDIKSQLGENAVIASFADFTGSTTITGNNTSLLGGGTFNYPVNLAVENLDFLARIKVITLGKFGICRADTTNGTAVLINGDTVEIRKINNGTTGTLVYSFKMPFSVEISKTYVLRLYKKNKDILFSIHSNKDFFIERVERTDEKDFGRNWGYPSVFCQSGQIEVIDASIRNSNFESPVTLGVGDSFIEGWGVVNNLDKRYIALMSAYTNGKVYISGRGGETTTTLLTRFDKELAKVSTKYVLLAIGTNDSTIATYKTNMAALIAKVKAAGRVPILVTITPRSGYPVTDMNAYVRSSGELFIDFNAAVNNGTETVWNPLFVNADNVHPNVEGNWMMFIRLLFDLYFLFDTETIYGAKTGINEFASRSNLNGDEVVYAPNGVITVTEQKEIGTIQGALATGYYIQPSNGQRLASADYHCMDFVDVRSYKGQSVLITGCFAYNSTTPASNAGIAGYSSNTEASFVAPFFTLPMAGITTNGRHKVVEIEMVIPETMNYLRGSSCFQNANGEELPLVIRLKDAIIPEEIPITDYVETLNIRVKALESGEVYTVLDLKEDIDQGTISDANGSDIAIDTRLRTSKYYSCSKIDISHINNGFLYYIFKYVNGVYVSGSGWLSVAQSLEFDENTSIRLAFRKSTNAVITTSEFNNIVFEAKALMTGNNSGGTLIDDVVSRNKEAEKAVLAVRKQFNTQSTTNERFIPFFAHTSDLHNDPVRLANFIKYCEHLGVDAGFVTGDIVSLYFTDDFSYYVNQVLRTNIPMFNTIGNHEAQNGTTDIALQAKFFTPVEVQNGATTEGKGYYYRDFASKKTRVIGINQFQQGGTMRERRYLKQDQITWLINTLKATPAGYAVVLLSHVPEHTCSKDANYSKFWQEKLFFDDLFSNITGSPIADIIDAFIGKTTINKSYTQNGELSTLTVSGDFSTVANGVEFIAHVNGHLHADRIGYLDNTAHKQLVLNIICGNAFVGDYRDGLGDLPRMAGTVCEDAFNVYGIDRVLGVVKIVRVGSNMNYKMEKRDFMAIPYK